MNQISLFIVTAVLVGISYGVQLNHNFGEKSEIHDQDHIKQHLEDKIDVDNVKIDPENEKWHYFSMHDLNNDGVIDGLELVKAMTHSHGGQEDILEDVKLETYVDKALSAYDLDNDGAISYTEYSIVSEKTEK